MSVERAEMVKEVLVRARGLIEKGWTQRAFARTEEGVAVVTLDEKATCFCAIGAIRRAAYELDGSKTASVAAENIVGEAILTVECLLPVGFDLPEFNDHRYTKQRNILDLFDNAVERLK